VRARDLGIVIGRGRPGPANAITDVDGVRVGQVTLVRGEGPLVVGTGPVRTGVTMIVPHDGDVWTEPIFAGCHRLNGNGELTGLEWIREAGHLTGPIGITNTHSVGVRDGIIRNAVRELPFGTSYWALPVVGETWDGLLNDIDGFHVTADHVDDALAAATDGPVAEGNVGGGTGMVCHEFKGGIGTASRIVEADWGGYTVGVLVQANYGRREWLRVDGVPVGEAIPIGDVPGPNGDAEDDELRPDIPVPGSGSIIGIIATDAPLLPNQCDRLAQRAGLGDARMGGTGAHSSGDLFLCFATGNRTLPRTSFRADPRLTADIRALNDFAIGRLFDATIEATEEAILNALVAAETMTGRDGITAHALPHDRLFEAMARFGRPARPIG
jgi:D-aminopeptidase